MEIVTAICRTLFHSLWEGALFALIAVAVIQLTRSSAAALRYRLLSALFILLVITVAVTFAYQQWSLSGKPGPQDFLPGRPSAGLALHSLATGAVQGFELSAFLNQNARMIVGIWLVVLILKMLWMLGVLSFTRYNCKRKAQLPAKYWQDKTAQLAAQLGLRKPVDLLESAFIQLPVVFGHFKPLIFVPLGLLAQLPPGQAEAILLHELAHTRRNDYLFNLLQNIAEILLFFNPALLWLSGRIRDEREHCCDDLAIARTGDRKQYIAALIAFREFQQPAYVNHLPAFTGSSSLLNRVRRIALHQNAGLSGAEKSVLAAFAMMAAFLFFLWSAPVKRVVIQLKQKIVVLQATRHPATPAQLPEMAAMITPVKRTLHLTKGKPHTLPRKTYTRLEPMIADVTADLVREKVIADPEELLVFELSNTTLTVNGIPQPQALQEKLRQRYLEDPPAAVDRQQAADPHFGLYYNARTGFTGMGIRN